ncbi:HAD family phosphatase [Clostridium sp. 19966]|uniref:Cof-type HAD-IIB family hydrolase n=1 Tax=Clostridium sp. 19966 TaxID=2768166 RepID=UPI0028DD627C|nr:Cof-type HAD-IIB family hydrolase [Clostridium sp. 19966]MDT8715372.1 HAD family phosphatase [Clostridium sp. 19966]
MMNYELCLCDMDGTLLNSKDIISKENEAALKKLQQNGVEVIIASGRVDLMVKSFIKQLDLKGHVISCNGGLIRNITTGEIIYSKEIAPNLSKMILNYCMDFNINFLVYTANMVYSNRNNPRATKFENLNKILDKDLQLPIGYIDSTSIEIIDNINVLKILMVCDDNEQVKLLQNKFSHFAELTVVSSANCLLDIMAANISKGNALKILIDKLGISREKVIAFGDNYNDLEMLQYAGMPIAMENSVEEIKKVGKYITKSNDESGIAYAINNFIFTNKD